jgi:hypothetical protein
VRNRRDSCSPAVYVNGRVSNLVISEALYTLQLSPIRKILVRCKFRQFGRFLYVASVTNSEALYTLQVSPIRKIFLRCKCHKFGGSIYVTSFANSEDFLRCKCHQFGGYKNVASITSSGILYTLQVSAILTLYMRCNYH